MRQQLAAHCAEGGTGLSPLVMDAMKDIRVPDEGAV